MKTILLLLVIFFLSIMLLITLLSILHIKSIAKIFIGINNMSDLDRFKKEMSKQKYMANLATIFFIFTIISALYGYFNNYLRPIHFLIPLLAVVVSMIIIEMNKKFVNKTIRNVQISNEELKQDFNKLIDSIFGKKKR